MNIGLAFKLFFKVMGNRDFAGQVSAWMAKPTLPAPKKEKPPEKTRTEAIELLAVLQREGRLVDFLKEKLDGYTDAQIGAAVRDIHRDCGKSLERIFGITALAEQPEGSAVSLPSDIDPGLWKLTGNVGPHPSSGKLCHHGWKITRHELPAWTGRDESAWVIAPAEIEIA